jgi:hypothetical protein
MRKRQASLSALCATVLVIAVNLSLLRRVVTGEDNSAIAGAIGVLFMGNLLAVEAGRILARRGRVLPHRIGFVVGGSLAVLSYLACCQLFPDAIEDLLLSIILPIHAFCSRHLPVRLVRDFEGQVVYAQALLYAGLIPTVALVFAFPQFLIALCGRWVGMKLIRHPRIDVQ